MKKLSLLSALLFLSACTGSFKAIEPTVNNNPEDLAKRLVSINEAISVSETITTNLPEFTHLVTITPPVVGGQPLRATSTIKLDSKLYISYNTEGAAVSGGVDIVDISHLEAPVLISSISTPDYDFTDLKSKGRALYLVGEKKNQGAVMVVMDIADAAHPVIVNEFLLPGRTATSLDVRGDRIMVATADNGGIIRFEVSYFDVLNPEQLRYNPFPNSLYLKITKLGGLDSDAYEPLIMGGSSDTHLYLLDKEMQLGAAASTSPSRFAVMGPLVYTNSSGAGLKITEMSNVLGYRFDGFLGSLALPGTGNGIAEMDQKLYVARGEGGLRYVNADEPGAPQEIGFFKFGDEGSANNVWVERYSWNFKVIAVADGKGGVRLVKEDSSNMTTDPGWLKVYARGIPLEYQLPRMTVEINGVEVGAFDVRSDTWALYHVNQPSAIPFGAEIKIKFTNDAVSLTEDRNLSIGYVKIGDDYYYPWWNNYFHLNNAPVYTDDHDVTSMYYGGYIKIIR